MAIDFLHAKGWVIDEEAHLLFNLASRLPGNALVLNIGVEYGQSLACLRAGNPTATIIGVDLDCSKAVSTYDCEFIQADSHDLVKVWRQPLDLIFVDGDHGELGVLLDAKFADFLPVGGHILFQDCWDHDDYSIVHQVCPGVNAGVDKWFLTAKQEFEELPSVASTRVFKRVKEHEQPRVADSGRVDTILQSGPITNRKPEIHEPKPHVPRRNKNSNRG